MPKKEQETDLFVRDDGTYVVLSSLQYRGRVEHAMSEFGPSMTRQEFADECDINQIMERAERDGVAWPPPLPGREPMYLDFTAMPGDLQSTLEFVKQAEASFMTLTANVRKEFDNDPLAFVAFAEDPKNLEQMRAWGLAKPVEKPAEPVKVEVVPGPGATAGATAGA